MERSQKAPIHILWTGGWDSTFRLLQALLVERRIVQPFYVMDSDRPSTGVEIRTMRDIKRHLFTTRPETRSLLLPTLFREAYDIVPNPPLSEIFGNIRARLFMGSQYEWLPRFCAEVGVDDMELCIHKDDKAHQVLEPFVIRSTDDDGLRYRVDPALENSEEYTVFKYFRFPIFDLTKVEMQAMATSTGFADVMELTWFCHNPRPGFLPCGVCNPCMYTIEEGLGRRIPFSSRFRSYFRILSRLKYFVRKHPDLYVLSRKVRNSTRLS